MLISNKIEKKIIYEILTHKYNVQQLLSFKRTTLQTKNTINYSKFDKYTQELFIILPPQIKLP